MKKLLTIAFLLTAALSIWAQENAANLRYTTVSDISYTEKTDDYAKQRLKLDIYYPEDATDCPVVVWFHGGGLTQGEKQFPWKMKEKGMVLVGVNYRLLPKVTIDECIDDAAEAVAWVFRNIEKYNGSPRKVFVSGHSAGGYLTMMLGLDRSWLHRYGQEADSIRALIPFSGQAISHFAYRDMNGMGNLQPLIDKYAPLFHVRKDCPELVLITGDRNEELFGRYEENAYLWRMMQLCGHTACSLYELDGFGHGSMAEPAYHIMEYHINRALGLPASR